MKLYTIEEITTKLQEWIWSEAIFFCPGDLLWNFTKPLNADECKECLELINKRWDAFGYETKFYVISEGVEYSYEPKKKNIYVVEIGMTNPAIEEYNSNRNLVL